MAPPKLNVKERLSDDGEIDLSMSDLHEVPVKEIGALKKAHILDLSNNHLKTLPVNFATLTHITKLDLGKNELVVLPENFGDLVKLKYLDLYQNKLQHLPVSFHKLKALRWLDLKGNPLTPALEKVAGPCTKPAECESSAKDVVAFFTQVQEQVTIDLEARLKQRQRQLELNQQKEMENKKQNKKKEKSKAKKDNGPGKEPPKNANNKQQQKKKGSGGRTTGGSSSICCCFFTLILLTLAALFVITSTKCEHTRFVEEKVVDWFDQAVKAVPPQHQVYLTTTGGYVRWAHDKTGNYTIQVVKYASNKDNYVDAYNKISVFVTGVIDKVKEQYKKYVS